MADHEDEEAVHAAVSSMWAADWDLPEGHDPLVVRIGARHREDGILDYVTCQCAAMLLVGTERCPRCGAAQLLPINHP